ncbi:Protein geranylgeranyltransferase Type I, beta subunit [Ceraceosorus bombacis]|uniref:Protein geranylgeranyltransferase Type I, beta subunit n=1 Tax=Ceraceosorus bombacis TaxID=401625 RepID=A0A0P1BCB1_9BASI|nr:Protein geranylgeranyltransferase Type I, beta subunit [Ceraceosorus bombacis]
MSSSITTATTASSSSSSSSNRSSSDSHNNPFSPNKHISLHARHLHLLPNAYQSAGADAQRIALAYFALSAIDLLSGVHDAARVDEQDRREWREWIWDRQVDGWRAIDLQKTLGYLARCRTFDGAFGQSPGEESHAGSTYCVLASLHLGGQLHTWLSPAEQQKTIHWLSHRQDVTTGGLAGRLNKETDVCYSFWVGASLAILGHHDLLDASADVRWILSAQSRVGGFGKVPDEPPDLLHSYLGLAALALHAHDDEQDNAAFVTQGPSEQHQRVDAETKNPVKLALARK